MTFESSYEYNPGIAGNFPFVTALAKLYMSYAWNGTFKAVIS